jgi:hypothetical protein
MFLRKKNGRIDSCGPHQVTTNKGEKMLTLLWKKMGLTLICLLAVAESAFGAGFGIYE